MASPLLIRCLEREAERELALQAFARLVPPYSYAEHKATCAGCVLFEVSELATVRAYYALRTLGPEHELEGRIVAAAAVARGECLTERVLPLIERQFRDVRGYSLGTHRRGLVRKLKTMGWRVAGYQPVNGRPRYDLYKAAAC